MRNWWNSLSENTRDNLSFIITIIICFPIALLIFYGCESYNENHPVKYDTYEICILDKYEDISSSWYLIGGRAPETEYHIYYKYCNRTKNTRWEETTCKVNGTKYRKYKVGDRLKVKEIEDCIFAPDLPK